MTIENITDRFEDLNPWDTVFRSDNGYTVKVKAEDISPSPSIMAFRFSGSWADDETGKAKPFGDSYFIGEPHEVVVRPDSPVDVNKIILDAQHFIVRRVELAVGNHVARQAMTNIRQQVIQGN